MEGKLIVFEGIEGCGKSTQLHHLQRWLSAHRTFQHLQAEGVIPQLITTREPGGTPLGQSLRTLLLSHRETAVAMEDCTELLLYAADRAQHVGEVIGPALKAGSWVLCDRFVDSTVAYQGYGRGLSLSLIEHLNRIATQGTSSHLTFWLQLDAEVGLARSRHRGQLDRMEQSTPLFHRRVQQGFEAIADTAPDRIVPIDASPAEDVVAEKIQSVVEARLQQWYSHILPNF